MANIEIRKSKPLIFRRALYIGKSNFSSVITTNAYGHIKKLLRFGDVGLSDVWTVSPG